MPLPEVERAFRIMAGMSELVERNTKSLVELCERYGVSRLDLFGSATGEAFDPEKSDLDFVVSFVPRTPSRLFERY